MSSQSPLTGEVGRGGTPLAGVVYLPRQIAVRIHDECVTCLRRLSPAEMRRRIWHIAPGCLPFVLWLIPHRDPIGPILTTCVLAIFAALCAGALAQYTLIARRRDCQQCGSVLGYGLSVLLTVLLFPAQLELGLTVLAIIAFGDGCATLGGLLFGTEKLPWNPRKSWVGTTCFLVLGTLLATLIYWGEAQPGVALPTAFACAAAATLAAALAESLPSGVNDNIRVGLTAMLTLAAAHGCLVGWS